MAKATPRLVSKVDYLSPLDGKWRGIKGSRFNFPVYFQMHVACAMLAETGVAKPNKDSPLVNIFCKLVCIFRKNTNQMKTLFIQKISTNYFYKENLQ